MFNNKTTNNKILSDGTEISLSLTIKSKVAYNTFDELKIVIQSVKTLMDEVIDETLRGQAIEATKDLLGIIDS